MKRRGVLDANKEQVLKMIDEEFTNKQIGEHFGVTGEAVGMFKKKYNVQPYERECALVGCGTSFTTTDPKKKFCTKKCAKAEVSRKYNGYDVQEAKCSNPECSNKVYKSKGTERNRFCSKYCSSRASHIRYQEAISVLSCAVCGEDLAVDLHHVVPRAMGGTDELTNLVCLCPTHHLALHRGTAELTHDMIYHAKGKEIPIKDVTHYGIDDAMYHRIRQSRGNLKRLPD